jgi:hypothetical protein
MPPEAPTPAPATAETPPAPKAPARRGPSAPKRVLHALSSWPRGRWPIPTITSLFALALAVVAIVELLPKRLSDVTLTVHARTEVVELELQPERTYVWWLPAGRYSLLTAPAATGCERREQLDIACTFAEPTVLTIKGGASVRFEVEASDSAEPRFTVALTPRTGADAKAAASTFDIGDSGAGTVVQTRELLAFESQPISHWRIPVIARRVQIGEFLSESVGAAEGLGGLPHEPIMIEGDVRMFARSLGSQERYQVKEERFDPADVVQVPAEPERDGLLLGLLSLDSDNLHAFALTLHTDLAEVFVRRLGAEHKIGVSMWLILSQLPLWLAFWVVWVSLIVVANYHAQRLAGIRDQHHELQET